MIVGENAGRIWRGDFGLPDAEAPSAQMQASSAAGRSYGRGSLLRPYEYMLPSDVRGPLILLFWLDGLALFPSLCPFLLSPFLLLPSIL